jgi:hypothetical protein
MAEFMDQVVRPFLTDAKGSGGLGWLSQTPAGSPVRGKGTTPYYEFLFSRGGVGTEAPPFFFCQTAPKTLFIYSGNGVDVDQESFDQPGNPVNEPPSDPVVDPSTSYSMKSFRCLALTTVVGSYDSYWVFGGETAEYFHMVLKVGAREYRHFHVGMLSPLTPELHPDSFYITNHRWAWLAPDFPRKQSLETTNTVSYEHQPYSGHLTPFGNDSFENVQVGIDARSKGMWIYSPQYGTQNYDWWVTSGKPKSADGFGGGGGVVPIGEWWNHFNFGGSGSAIPPTKTLGDVNTNLESPLYQVIFGSAWCGGYDKSLGMIPYQCEPTFTTDGVALIPIMVGLHSDFESLLRWSPVAKVPDVFRVNMKSLDAEQEITIGSDTYIVFPMMNKDANNTVAGEGYSGYEGLAYKKITANAT